MGNGWTIVHEREVFTFNKTLLNFQVVSGGIDNDLKIWDLRKGMVETCMKGHTDTVTGMHNLFKSHAYKITAV